MSFDNTLFSATIQARLIKRNISLRAAARESGVSVSTLSRIARGETPDIEHFTTLLSWLDVDANQFFRSGPPQENDEDNGWVTLYSSLQRLGVSDELIDAIATIIRQVKETSNE